MMCRAASRESGVHLLDRILVVPDVLEQGQSAERLLD